MGHFSNSMGPIVKCLREVHHQRDVSLLTIEDGIFGVMATAGDRHLGGEDLTTASWTSASRASSASIVAKTWQATRVTLSRASTTLLIV